MGQILCVAANSLKNDKSSLGIYFRKIQTRKGHKAAIVATANKMGRIRYTMIMNQTEYQESLGQDIQVEILKKKIKRSQMELDKLQKQINDCENETCAE